MSVLQSRIGTVYQAWDVVKVPSTKLIALICHYHPSIILQSGSGFGIETCSNSQSHSTA